MSEPSDLDKEVLPTLLTTGVTSKGKLSEGQDNLAIFVNNIVLYCKLVENQQIDAEG
jgi:hypothetical protein